MKFEFKKQEPIYQEKIEEASTDYLREFLNGFFSELRSRYSNDMSKIILCVDNSLKGNTDLMNFLELTKKAKDLKTIISLFHSGAFVFRDLASVMSNCKASITSISEYFYDFAKFIIEHPRDAFDYIYNNIINNIPTLAINIIEIQDMFQNKNYYEVSGIFAGKIYNIIVSFLRTRKQNEKTISLFQIPENPISIVKSNRIHKENCTKLAVDSVKIVNDLITKSESKDADQKPLVGLMNSLFSLYDSYNKECTENTNKLNLKSTDLKSIFFSGLDSNFANKTIEASHINTCKEKLDNLLNLIEKGMKGFKDLNNFNEVLTSINEIKTFLSNLRKENTICNNLVDKINSLYKEEPKTLVDENQIECEKIAQTISIEISKLIKHTEDKTYNPKLMVTLSNNIYLSHVSYNKKCINMAIKFSLPYYDLKSVYYYGLDLHSKTEENSVELKYVQNCKDKIDNIVTIVEKGFAGLKDLNNFNLLSESHSNLKKAVENQRKENTICNSLMDKLYEHLTTQNTVNETTSNVLRKMDQEGCKNMANLVVTNINEIIKKTEDPNILREEGELIKLSNLVFNLLKQFNTECIDTSSSSSIAKIDLKSLYIHGLENHAKNDEKDKPEDLYVKSCKERIEKIVSIIQEELIPNNDLNSMLKVTKESMILKDLLTKLRSENTICNQLMDRVYSHFQVKAN
jgi:hypothetical protein